MVYEYLPILSVAITAGYAAGCLGAGYLLLHLVGLPMLSARRSQPAIMLATAFLLGQAVVSQIWILAGLVSLFTPVVVIVFLLACALAGIPKALGDLRGLGVAGKDALSAWKASGMTSRFVVLLVIALITLHGLAAYSLPPIGDADAYYLPYAKIIAASGRLTSMPGPYQGFSVIGIMGELQLAALLMLGNLGAAKLFVWFVALAGLAALAAVAALAGVGRIGTYLLLGIVLTSTTFTHFMSDGKVDLFAAALGLCACYWALHTGAPAQRLAALRLTAVFTALAIVAKLSYAVALVPSIAILVAWEQPAIQGSNSESVNRWHNLAGAFGVLAIWGFTAAIPHLIKNSVLFNAPLAPFVGTMDGINWTLQEWFAPEVTRRIVMTFPFTLVFGRYPGQGGNVSFLWTAWLPLALFLPRPRSWSQSVMFRIFAAGAAGILIWLFLRPSFIAPRYWLATLLLLIPLAAKGAEHVIESEGRPKWLTAGVILTLALASAMMFVRYIPPLVEGFSDMRRGSDSCPSSSLSCTTLLAVNRAAGLGARVYFEGYYGYYLRPDLLQCRNNTQDEKILKPLQIKNFEPEAFFQRGFEYLILDQTTQASKLERLLSAPRPNWLELARINETRGLVILRLSSSDPAHRPVTGCRQISPSAWEVVSAS